ncbi:Programmed cell death protein 2 [Galemys pyrenaicus]|uniref:Programmed cell death protein 2 n=1 Tax=Galemys pyrenaicus TaxID=202257 RepID=A0A8J5ZR91_GALPY|nr:Programmed cell death protein 2 [Galemys pyrenaicus]
MAAARPAPAELGLAQAAPAWRLLREQFPSKVGGRPAWLGAAGLPGPAALSCEQCGRPLAFLLQLYAPLPGRADAFHRGLFLFCCRAPPCCAGLREHLGDTMPDHNFLFPEYEIIIETEDEAAPEVENEDEAEVTGSMDEMPEEELDSLAKHESREDKIFQKFKAKVDLVPEQILRYGRGIAPIWISGENIPQEKDIPDCPCGAKRIFEFQVMPQLLYYLKADRLGRSVDWGVLAIFTCAKSCRLGTGYTEEFVWKQDVTAAP